MQTLEATTQDREIVLTRVFDAPRELVFDTWTDPKHISEWWGPNGFTTTTYDMDVRPGGQWSYTMHGPNGVDYPNWIRYIEVVKPELLHYDHGGEADQPAHFQVTVTFDDLGGKTKVTLHSVFPTVEALAAVKKFGAVEGGNQTLARFADYLFKSTPTSNDPEVFITRTFDAPRDVVFRAWTDPAQLNLWYAPNGCRIEFKSIEVRTGGAFHSCMHIPGGRECWCIGTYREVEVPSRIVHTFAVADANGNATTPEAAGMDHDWPSETVVTLTFVEQDGKTTVTLHQTVSQALAERTGAYPSWLQMLDNLSTHLKSIA